jgi:hypothetical protein
MHHNTCPMTAITRDRGDDGDLEIKMGVLIEHPS